MLGQVSQNHHLNDTWCIEILRRIRWPEGVRCIWCDRREVRRHSKSRDGRQRYKCGCDPGTFTDLTGTVFARSNLPLSTWFRCLRLMGQGLSTAKMARALGVKWDTALHMRRRLGPALADCSWLHRLREILIREGF